MSSRESQPVTKGNIVLGTELKRTENSNTWENAGEMLREAQGAGKATEEKETSGFRAHRRPYRERCLLGGRQQPVGGFSKQGREDVPCRGRAPGASFPKGTLGQ